MSLPIPLLILSTLHSARAADYDGDGFDDLVVGVPHEALDGVSYAGAVEVIRGSSTGLTSTGDAFLHQDTAGVSGSLGDDLFGQALGAGDIDGDGNADLIVSAPLEPVRSTNCGAIWRLELAPTRASLAVTESQLFSQYTTGVSDSCEETDLFGAAVAVADFDGDGYDDVVVGVPGEDIGTEADAGAVHYLRGSATGLTTSGQLYYDQDVANVAGRAEADDWFGTALAAGDFDADGYADLAIGVPKEDWILDEGSVHVLYGSSTGPGAVSPDDQIWTAGLASVAGELNAGNECGTALAVGDFDGDGYDDLAIGCPEDYSTGPWSAGTVLVVYGSSAGLDESEVWNQDSPGLSDTAEEDDWFGAALTSGDYDGDGYDDLAVAAPTEDRAGRQQSGIVQVLFGSSTGLTDVDNLVLAQDVGSAVLGTPSDDDEWGSALASGDYDGDGRDDLVVGAPNDDEGRAAQGGIVNVFYGSASGPSSTGNQLFHQGSTGIEDASEASDLFGFSLR